MTLPKGYAPGGGRAEGAGPRDEIERMIGRRVEHMNGVFVMGFILCWIATAGGIYVGVTVYPWAYPLPSGMFAGSGTHRHRSIRINIYHKNCKRKTNASIKLFLFYLIKLFYKILLLGYFFIIQYRYKIRNKLFQ